MSAVILLHFGSPENKRDVSFMIESIFDDTVFSPFRNNILLKLIKKPLKIIAVRSSAKKYESIGFDRSYLSCMENLKGSLAKNLKSGSPVFIAAHYGRPSIEEVFEKMEDAKVDRAVIVPLYPHASPDMYDSIVMQTHNLRSRFFSNIHLNWAAPFFDHPLFIKAWADSIAGALNKFPDDEQDKVHILFCAHAHPVSSPLIKGAGHVIYGNQVEITAHAVLKQLGSRNPMSVAYQSASKFGRWSTPSLADELKRLISKGVLNCVIAPVSFLFDNMETLLDIDSAAISLAFKGGMKKVLKAALPGSQKIILEMFIDIIKKSSKNCL
jgi:ferrochelatase